MNFQILIDALTKILTDIVSFIPNLVNGLIILIVGYLLARIVRWLTATLLGRLRFDQLIERSGVAAPLRGLGVTTPLSQVAAQTLFLLLLISFLTTATRLMGLEAVAQLLEEILRFLPRVIAALIIFLLGSTAAQFVGRLIGTAGAAGGVQGAERVGRIVQYLVTLFVVVLTLSQLGIDTAILVTALTICIAAFGLALGIGLGLSARTILTHILAGYYVRQRFAAGQPIALNELRGEVDGVGSVSTLVRTGDGAVVIPNALLLESVVRSPAAHPADNVPG